VTEARRSQDATEEQLWLALLTADWPVAEGAARELDAQAQSELSEQDHYEAFTVSLDAMLEAGDRRSALALADAYERRSQAWTADRPLGIRMRIAFLRRHAGRIDQGALESVRQELLRQATSLGAKPGETWRAAYGRDCETTDDARAALAALPDGGLEIAAGQGLLGAWLGRAFLLAGRPLEALPWLRQGASACAAMIPPVNPNLAEGVTTVDYVRAQASLGEALERTGDHSGACSAYGEVVTRWSHPVPRSVTVQRARERWKALGCAGRP
jgi:eukaryotic-like serine/threonine-protein kinase